MFNEKSESIAKITPAFNKALSEVKNLAKSKKGYGYNYTPLDDVLDAVRPLLKKHGLSVTQLVGSEGSFITIKTVLLHDSGEYLSTVMALPPTNMSGVNDVQALGASITYGRRYQLTALLGIASEEDVDGSVKQQAKPATRPQTQKQQTKPKEKTPEERQKAGVAMIQGLMKGLSDQAYIDYEALLDAVLEVPEVDERLTQLEDLYKQIKGATK